MNDLEERWEKIITYDEGMKNKIGKKIESVLCLYLKLKISKRLMKKTFCKL